MNKTMVFTVTYAEGNDKPIIYAQMASTTHRNKQELAVALIRDWINNSDVAEATDKEIEDLAYHMRYDGYAWWNEEVCFELTEVYG